MKKTPMTNGQLFDIINKQLEADGLIPEILDYSAVDRDSIPIKSYSFDVVGVVNFGGNEGIYLDVYAKGYVRNADAPETIHLGAYKTLDSSKEAFKIMSDLNVEFVFHARDYITKHIDDFDFIGWKVSLFNEGETESGAEYKCYNASLVAGLLCRPWSKKYDYALVTNMETREVVRHEIKK